MVIGGRERSLNVYSNQGLRSWVDVAAFPGLWAGGEEHVWGQESQRVPHDPVA